MQLWAQDVHAVAGTARPSTSEADRAAMDKRYAQFTKAREGSGQSPFSAAREAAQKSATAGLNTQRVAMA